MRRLRFSWALAFLVAIAYTFLPYHFWHEQDHLFRSTYYSAPLACLLLLWALSWRTTFLKDPDSDAPWRSNLRRGNVIAAVALAIVVGTTETMTTAFTMTLLVASAAVAAIRWREPRRLLVGGGLAALIMASFLVVSSPVLLYWAENGGNSVALDRQPAESELYGLKISRMLLPEPGHRIDALSELGAKAQQGTLIVSEPGQALGLLGAVGFLTAVLTILLHGLRRRGARDLRPVDDRGALRDHASLLVVLAVLFAVIGGGSVLLSLIGFSQVRTWNRTVAIIAFLSLVLTCTWIERGQGWLRRRRPGLRPALVGVLPLALLPLALFDGQHPFPENSTFKSLSSYEESELQWVSDERFVADIESALPDGAAVFQFPVLPHPEGGAQGSMRPYDHLRGYIHDDGTLRWSYGGMKGRPESTWQERVPDDPVVALPALLGMGFQGLWIDSHAYGTGIGGLDTRLTEEIGAPPLISGNGRLRFWDLRAYRDSLERSAEELRAFAERRFGIVPPG
jgi:phosphoglycerol transferase